ncbi:Uncharacterised protein [Edwardsiella tarda]|nr:Uncharacterised protein [Edwardsiella tarda]
MLCHQVDRQRPIVVTGDVAQHLADVKQGMTRQRLLAATRMCRLLGLLRMPAGEAKAF